MDGETIREARLALGGVAHKPWRDPRGRGAAARARRRRGTASGRRPRPSCATPGASATTTSRSSWRGGRSSARLARGRRDGEGRHEPTAHIGKPRQPRRRPRQGDRRGEVRRRVQRPGPRLRLWSSPAPSPGGRSSRSTPRQALTLAGRAPGLHAREHAAASRWFDRSYRDEVAPPGSPFRPLHDAEIQFSGQPVALVVAETLRAGALRRDARAGRVRARAARHRPGGEARRGATSPRSGRHRAAAEAARPRRQGLRRGRRCGSTPSTSVPVEHHNPMEMFATTVVRDEDGKLTVYDKTQGVQNVRDYLCSVFGFSEDERARRLAVRRRGVRLRPAPAVSGLPGRPGGARAEALGPGGAHAPADVHLRAPPDDPAARRARRRGRRHARGGHPRGDRRDLAVRGLHRGRRQLVGPALPVRQRPARAQGRPARPATPRATCARPGPPGACSRSSRAMDELAVELGDRPGRAAAEELRRGGPERRQAVLEQGAARVLPRRPPSGSAGRGATPSRARCATGDDADRLGHGQRRLGGRSSRRPRRRPC